MVFFLFPVFLRIGFMRIILRAEVDRSVDVDIGIVFLGSACNSLEVGTCSLHYHAKFQD